MGNERSACCERIGVGKADQTTHLDSMDGQPAISDISAHSTPNITNLKASMSGAKNTRMTTDSTQNDTMSSKSPDLPPQEVDLINATPIQSNRVPTEFSTKTSQKNKKKSCVNSNRLRRTAKNPSRSDTLQQKKEEPGGANDDRKTTKSKAEVIKVCRSTKKGTSRPKLGTISGLATDRSISPSQNAEATEKTTVPSQLKQDDLSLSSKFPALFDGAPSELSTNATGSTESQRRRRPRISISAPLEIPEFPKKPKNPRADIKRFCSDYANKFAIGSRHTVEFFNGSFDDAQKESRNAIRLMLVFFHDPTSEDSKRFIHESMNSIEFGELISRNQLIVWGVAKDSEEGKYVAFIQQVNKFPFLALMCPRSDGRFFTASRISGFTTARNLVDKLQKSIDTLQTELKELKKQRERIMENRRLMQEQEEAYKESAERDRQKILEVKKARQEKLDAEKKQKKKQNEMEQRRQVIAEMREQLKLQGEHQPIGNDLINVQVRFPSGKKFAKKFSLDDNLEKLFTAILCHDTCPDFFTVATGFPRSEIHCAPEWYHSLLCAQMVADGLAPSPFRPASSFRALGLVKAVGVFVNNHCPYSGPH